MSSAVRQTALRFQLNSGIFLTMGMDEAPTPPEGSDDQQAWRRMWRGLLYKRRGHRGWKWLLARSQTNEPSTSGASVTGAADEPKNKRIVHGLSSPMLLNGTKCTQCSRLTVGSISRHSRVSLLGCVGLYLRLGVKPPAQGVDPHAEARSRHRGERDPHLHPQAHPGRRNRRVVLRAQGEAGALCRCCLYTPPPLPLAASVLVANPSADALPCRPQQPVRAVISFKWRMYGSHVILWQLAIYSLWLGGFCGFVAMWLETEGLDPEWCAGSGGCWKRTAGLWALGLSTMASLPFLVWKVCSSLAHDSWETMQCISSMQDYGTLALQYAIAGIVATVGGSTDLEKASLPWYLDIDVMVSFQSLLLWINLSKFLRCGSGAALVDHSNHRCLPTLVFTAYSLCDVPLTPEGSRSGDSTLWN